MSVGALTGNGQGDRYGLKNTSSSRPQPRPQIRAEKLAGVAQYSKTARRLIGVRKKLAVFEAGLVSRRPKSAASRPINVDVVTTVCGQESNCRIVDARIN